MGIAGIKDLRKQLHKNNIDTEIKDPTNAVSVGNYAINEMITGDFRVGLPNKRSFVFWGPQGSGKSLLLASAAAAAQKEGYHVFWVDTENAASTGFMKSAGLNVDDEDQFTVVTRSSLEEIIKALSHLWKALEPGDKLFLVMDSISNIVVKKQLDDFAKGDMKADQGLLAKNIKALVKLINEKLITNDMFFGCAGHSYVNQDLRNGKGTHIFSGGEGVEFLFSNSVFVKKTFLKNKDKEVTGIEITARTTKNRFHQPGIVRKVQLPYDRGLSEYDGLLELLVDKGIVEQKSAWYSYVDDNGEIKKFQSKRFPELYKDIMAKELAKPVKFKDYTPQELKEGNDLFIPVEVDIDDDDE